MEVDLKKIAVKQETIEICEFSLNPYQMTSRVGSISDDRQWKRVGGYADAKQKSANDGKNYGETEEVILNGRKRYIDRPAQDKLLKICGVKEAGMRKEILSYIETHSRVELKELAVLLGSDEITVANEIADMEKEKIICGYHTLIDWDKAGVEKITALIEVRVTPQRNQGFDRIAERIYNYPEVSAVYLISGGYDLLVTLEGKTLKEVSMFVSKTFTDRVGYQYGDTFYFEKI